MLAAEWGVGQAVWTVFWSTLIFSIFFLWIWLVIRVFVDIVRNRDLGGFAKGIWAIVVIMVPVIGVFFYLIVHGQNMHEREAMVARA